MMNLIPGFRLPRAVVEREARAILDAGIELVTGTEFGKDITWNQLKRRGYRALLLGTGAWRPAWKWGAPGVEGRRARDRFPAARRFGDRGHDGSSSPATA